MREQEAVESGRVEMERVEQRRYPFEVAHVGCDRRSALEGQVADRRRRCAALVVAHVDLHTFRG